MKAAFFACLFAIATAAQAQDAGKSVLLVASPGLQGPYSQTTLVAVPNGGRHFGFILNRATDVKLSAMFPGHAPSAKVALPVYIGGPEMNDALFAVVARNPGANSLRLFGGLFVTNRAASIDRIIAKTPNDARYFAGFVTWAPGELEGEIARGLWHVTEPEAALVFRADTSNMWEELVKRLGVDIPQRRGRGMIQARLGAGPG
jgi:putative transcriptional regulator